MAGLKAFGTWQTYNCIETCRQVRQVTTPRLALQSRINLYVAGKSG
jgi:hypothetical protein